MVFCRKALGEGDHVHLSGLGSLFLVVMTAQAVIIGLGWSPETTLRRCRRSTPAAAELEEREQGSQPAKKVQVGWGGKGGPMRAARALPRAARLLRRPRSRGQVTAPFRPRAPPREGRAVAVSPQRNLLRRLPQPPPPPPPHPTHPPTHPSPPCPPGPLLSGTHDESRNASGLNLALENYTGEPTAPGDKPG